MAELGTTPHGQQVNLVVTCTKLKRVAVAPELRLQDIKAPTLEEAFGEWTRRLAESSARPVKVSDLYAGDAWNVVRSLEQEAAIAGYQPKLWVCSAGYGIVASSSSIKPYSAAFSPSDPDSVARWATSRRDIGAAYRAWWKLLSEWCGPDQKQPRSLAQLAEQDQRVPLLVAVSGQYLSAIKDDILIAARQRTRVPLALFSIGGKADRALQDFLMPGDTRFQSTLGGSLRSINVRVLRRVLQYKVSLTIPSLKSNVEQWLQDSPPRTIPARTRVSDRNVQRFVRRAVARDPNSTANGLLREFRSKGYACEQARFKALFLAATCPPLE